MKNAVAFFRSFVASVVLLSGIALLSGCGYSSGEIGGTELLNVSYDPTRELYKEYDAAFAKHWKETTGETVTVHTSNAGSGKQARSVIDGLGASVVTLALAYDIDAIAEKGLLAKDWQTGPKKLPNNNSPYLSTILFLVRKGNPKGIRDWDDLIKPGVEIITPHPKTSGGARWNYLAAWGFALDRELGDLGKLRDPKQAEAVEAAQKKAKEFVSELYHHVKILDSGARDATITFVRKNQGDVLIAWENEALQETQAESGKGMAKFEVVAPSISILAEPPVAVVDTEVDRLGTRKVAEGYLKYLYSPEGQRIAAKNFYRPSDNKSIDAESLKPFAHLKLFTVDEVFGGWQNAQKTHFADKGVFDEIYTAK
ncbi:MAG: sulfate ABC transporter substrate-binding protein [Thermoguttaceae bacterium]|jgi:sulfate transport system substrate-binding protein